ncbi:S-adenosyl-L-methionine-dependent methyltransferase [Sporodiniella umbellata]|nr:S-adenosyl-L-methionine-dependent methyltransferase [Sporodiniella umbellata]
MNVEPLNTEFKRDISPDSLTTNREFHNEEASTYWLPKDAKEHDRLTKQHFIFKELFQGNILSSVKKSLNFEHGVSVLDIGCGSGAWMADMSSEYPKCSYQGCDIIDAPDVVKRFPNLKYDHGNVVQGLPYKDGTFDFVHMRFFVYALQAEEWPIAIKEAIRVTKTGGIIQFVENAFVPPKNKDSLCYRVITCSSSFSKDKGQLPNIRFELESLVLANAKVEILQACPKLLTTNDGSPLAERYACNLEQGLAGVIKYIGPSLGIRSEAEISDYLVEFRKDTLKNDFQASPLSLSVLKKCD